MKVSKYKVKLICGFRPDQEYTIDANEAHKAYYLFNNPEKRGVFENGLAVKGADIQRIVPDYSATMGWNADHKLTGDDYNQLNENGVMHKLRDIMTLAKEVAKSVPVEQLKQPLIDFRADFQYITSSSELAKHFLLEK